jgi:F-type H+-transporting ATPase subunit delta
VHVNQIAREYAQAIMQFASSDYADISAFFGKIATVVKESHTFSNLLNHPAISSEEKHKALLSLSDKKQPQVVEKVVYDLVSRRGIDIISLIQKEIDKLYKNTMGIQDATVTSAEDLTEYQKNALITSIEQHCGFTANVSFTKDPTLLAGFKIKIGDTVLDNTVKRQLQIVGDLLSFTNRV